MPALTALLTAVTLLATPGVTWSAANSAATGDQDGSAVAADRNGHVAVVWEDDRDTSAPADDDHSDVWLRVWSDGVPVFEEKLSAGGTGAGWRHVTPDVALDDKGDAVVVWAEDPDGNGAFNVAYRVVSPTGTVLASGRANADATGDQIRPRVAVDPDGTPARPSAVAFTVVWEDVQGGADVIKAAGFTDVATKAYEKTASQTTGTHHHPDVAVAAGGDATVVWDEDADGNGYDNVGLTRLARADGRVLIAPRTANADGGGQQRHASIAQNYHGDFVVAWESDHTGTNGVWARSFTAGATARHAEVRLSTAAGAAWPRTGLDDQAGAVVGWTTGGADGFLRGVNPDGTFTGRLAEQTVTQTTTGRQDQFQVAVSPWGEVAVAYTDDSDGNGFDQVVLGLGTASS